MLDSTVFTSLRISTFLALAFTALGSLAGCTVIVGDDVGHHGHDEEDIFDTCVNPPM